MDIEYIQIEDESEQGFFAAATNSTGIINPIIQHTIQPQQNNFLTLNQCYYLMNSQLKHIYQLRFDTVFQSQKKLLKTTKIVRKFQRIVMLAYDCSCSHKWRQYEPEPVTISFNIKDCGDTTCNLITSFNQQWRNSILDIEQRIKDQLQKIENLQQTIFLVNYSLEIPREKCEKCNKQVYGQMNTASIISLVREFGFYISDILKGQTVRQATQISKKSRFSFQSFCCSSSRRT